jgi:hypothetical protein
MSFAVVVCYDQRAREVERGLIAVPDQVEPALLVRHLDPSVLLLDDASIACVVGPWPRGGVRRKSGST